MTELMRRIENILEAKPALKLPGPVTRRFDRHSRADVNPFIFLEDYHYRGTGIPAKSLPLELNSGTDTITYLMYGSMACTEGGSNAGILNAGGCRWMENMPYGFSQETPVSRGEYWSVHFSLYTDHLIKHEYPRIMTITEDEIPVHRGEDGIITRIIAGEFEGICGPGGRMPEECLFLDISIPPLTPLQLEIPEEYRVLTACMEGKDLSDMTEGVSVEEGSTLLYSTGTRMVLSTGADEARLLVLGARPR